MMMMMMMMVKCLDEQDDFALLTKLTTLTLSLNWTHEPVFMDFFSL